MEVGAVSSLVTTSNSSNPNNSNQSNNNNNNNGNSQLIDEANHQSHQQRAQYIISAKGISNCLGNNSIVSAADTNVGTHSIEPVCATTITNCPTVEAATAAESSESSDLHTNGDEEGEREDNLALIVDIVSKIISEVVQHMPSDSDNTISPTKPAIKDNHHQVQSNLPRVSLDIPNPNQTTDSQTSKPQDLSPDEASSDLVIDADITSNDFEDDSPENEQPHSGNVEIENQERIEQPPATETITISPPTLICTQQNPAPSECETPTQVHELPLSSVNNQAKELDEGKVDETSKTIDPDVNINLLNDDNQLTIVNDDDQEDKTKDIVTLRNLEITPPPQPPLEDVNPIKESDGLKTSCKAQSGKRKRSSVSETTSESGQVVEEGRSKRQRTQTRLFQAGDIKNEAQVAPKSTGSRKSRSSTASIPRSRKSTASSTSDKSMSIQNNIVQQPNESHDVIFYEKDDYLAVRSEENTFYLCQLIENVKVGRPLMRIRWLDTNDDGQTYFLTKHQDKVFQKSILMPVIPNIIKSEKKGKQIFSIDDQVKANIMDRLNKSLSAQAETVISEQAH